VKYIIAILLLVVAGCTAPGQLKPETPAQIATQVCPPLQTTMGALGALVLDPKVTADLVIAGTAINMVCGAGATINLANLQTASATAVPVIVGAIKSSPLPDAQKNVLILDVTAAQIILQGAIQAATNVKAAT
jgi:small basic protein